MTHRSPPQEPPPQAPDIAARLRQAIGHHQDGRIAEAERLYRDILAIVPGHFDALHLLGVAATQRGSHAEAAELIRAAIATNPNQPAARTNLGLALQKAGKLADALASFDAALALQPDSAAARYNRGNVLRGLKRSAEALADYDRALALLPGDAGVLCNRGNVLRDLSRPAEALASYDEALARAPDDPDTLFNRGLALADLARTAEALASLERALAARPRDALMLYHLGNLLRTLRRPDDAAACYDRALALQPGNVAALNNRGLALQESKRPADALASFDRALDLGHDSAPIRNNRGNVLFALNRFAAALADYERAIAIDPQFVESLVNCGSALRELKRYEQALTRYDQALAAQPDHVDALNNRGNVLRDLGRATEALASYERAHALRPDDAGAAYNRGALFAAINRPAEAAIALRELVAIAPDYDYALGTLHECHLKCCDWTRAGEDARRIADAVDAGRRAVMPFAFLAMSDSAELQLKCARTYIADRAPPSPSPMWRGERYAHERIRVAYLSADLREHPVAYLMAELFERHDRTRFETVAVAWGAVAASPMRTRLTRAFDHFLDVERMSDDEVAGRLRQLEIDIAVDLTGITAAARPGILARRPAPVQVSYLGFPGTSGAPHMDYLIADRYVIPEAYRKHYAEQVVYLPDSFQATDATRVVGPAPARSALGLPEDGFVYCAFNNSYKITPEQFGRWLAILGRVAGSVLWLVGGDAVVECNLRRSAAAGGVEPERLVFAPRVGYGEHLSRCAVADLFLDTLPFNGGTTASDALWAGLPVLTCSGAALAARMAGSLLRAVGLPELIAASPAAYVEQAVQLGREPARLAGLRAKLAANRLTQPLFDSDRFRRHLEAAYLGMWQRCQRGEAAQAFTVPSLALRT